MNAWELMNRARIAAIEIEVEGMKALNNFRLNRNEAIAYTDDAFFESARELREIAKEIEERITTQCSD